MKNKFLWAFLCLGLLLVYFNCEKDEVTVKEKQEIKTSNGQITPTIKMYLMPMLVTSLIN